MCTVKENVQKALSTNFQLHFCVQEETKRCLLEDLELTKFGRFSANLTLETELRAVDSTNL